MLTLPIKKKWFDMILSGEKKEEYREIKLYWTKRFENNLNAVILNMNYRYPMIESAKGIVMFKNGYQKEAPKIKCFVELRQDYGKEEWGAEPNKEYYVLKILRVEEVK